MDTIDRIFELLEQKKIAQFELAKLIGISQGVLTHWKQRVQKPSVDMIIKLAGFFKVSADYLLGLSDKPDVCDTNEVYSIDETDLIGMYRRLTPNSKQIIMTLTYMEYRHIKAYDQGEIPIKVISESKKAEIKKAISSNAQSGKGRGRFLKVYNQVAAAGSGNYLFDNGEADFEKVSMSCIPAGTEFGIRISGDSMEPEIRDGEIVFVKREPQLEIGEIGIFVIEGESFCKKLVYKDNSFYLRSLNSKYKDIPLSSKNIYTVGKVLFN